MLLADVGLAYPAKLAAALGVDPEKEDILFFEFTICSFLVSIRAFYNLINIAVC